MNRGIQANVEAQLARLESFRVLLDGMFREASGHAARSTRLTLFFASLLKVIQSAGAVRLLSEAGCVEEVLALGHTLVEVTVNAAYFQVATEQELDRFYSFHPESRPGHPALLSSSQSRGFAFALVRKLGRIFSGKQPARQVQSTAWSEKSIMGRAELADERSHIPVMVPLVARCYHRGQGAVSGSVGSLDAFLLSVKSMAAPGVDNRMADLSEALFGVNLCLLTICLYLDEYFHLGMEREINEAANAETLTRSPLLEASPLSAQRYFPGSRQEEKNEDFNRNRRR